MKNSLNRCVAVVGAPGREREYTRRALRWLGISPFVFDNSAEFRHMDRGRRRFQMLVMTVAPGVEEVDIEATIAGSKVLLPNCVICLDGIPVVNLKKVSRQLKRPAYEALPLLPRSFATLFGWLYHATAEAKLNACVMNPTWGSYKFLLQENKVQVLKEEKQLTAAAFDLALELFTNAGRSVSARSQVRTASGSKKLLDEPSLNDTVASLTKVLRLDGSYGWILEFDGSDGLRLSQSCPRPIAVNVPMSRLALTCGVESGE